MARVSLRDQVADRLTFQRARSSRWIGQGPIDREIDAALGHPEILQGEEPDLGQIVQPARIACSKHLGQLPMTSGMLGAL